MQVLDSHVGFVSNYEVLKLLEDDVRQQDNTIHAFKRKHAKRRKADSMQPGVPYFDIQAAIQQLVPENLRSLQIELLRYLKQTDLPCTNQSSPEIKRAMRDLANIEALPEEEGSRGSNALTKTEKLMLINLAPQALVELTVICDELDTRFTEGAQQRILDIFIQAAQTNPGKEQADVSLAIVKQEDEDMQEAEEVADQHEHEAEEQVYNDEELPHQYDMPEEEDDLVHEGAGDGGRDAEIREIDEILES